MQKRKRSTKAFSVFSFGLMVVAILAACATPTSRSMPETQLSENGLLSAGPIQPIRPQPVTDDILPGLSVTYFRNFSARHLDHLPRGEYARELGRKGSPILFLDHVFGKEEVFESGEKRLLGMRMQGLLRFPRSGRYQLKAFVNDGIRLYLDNQLVLDDPKWDKAGDRFTKTVTIEAVQGVWYPVMIEYFQRKGTATLQLFWQIPQSDTFDSIPAEAYAHIGKG